MSEEKQTTPKKKKSMNFKSVLVVLIIVVSVGAAGYFWNEAQNAKEKTPEATQQRNQAETDQVVNELKNLIFIDSEEQPTVARVEDPQVLKDSNPDFYKNTEAGDYLVLYPQRAIIYRSSNKQVINIAPIINAEQIQDQADSSDNENAN